jgi:molybdopterin/thiamine biosynthesis adenylyltransferase
MITVLAIAFGLLLVGRWSGVSKRAQISVLIVLFTAVLFFQLTLPADNPLRVATGGSAWNWAIAAGIGVLVWGYRTVLKRLRARHDDAQPVAAQGVFSGAELDRYARHIVLREVGGAGQKKLKNASVLVIGAGGLGAPALQYLGAAGVGTIGIIDDDIVDNSNLQRQVIHTDERIGMPKVFSAEAGLRAQNPFVKVKPYNRRLDAALAHELFAEYDLILDGTDNFETRYMVNATCVILGKPLISAAITQWEGQISLYHPKANAPCYACAFPVQPDRDLAPSCAEAGVMGALPGVVGSMMAVEAIKWITGAGETLAGRLMLYDALYADSRIIKISRDPNCAVCS